MISQQVK